MNPSKAPISRHPTPEVPGREGVRHGLPRLSSCWLSRPQLNCDYSMTNLTDGPPGTSMASGLYYINSPSDGTPNTYPSLRITAAGYDLPASSFSGDPSAMLDGGYSASAAPPGEQPPATYCEIPGPTPPNDNAIFRGTIQPYPSEIAVRTFDGILVKLEGSDGSHDLSTRCSSEATSMSY